MPGVGSLTGRIADLRARLGADVFQKVAGDEGPGRRKRIHSAPGPRWFAQDRPIRRVHGDASMFVGGLRALLLQSLHPLAMAGVAGHSGYRGDPWGRLARTSYFLAATTFGPTTRPAPRSSGSRRCTPGCAAGRRTAGRTRRPTRTSWSGCTSPRSTASCAPTSATAPPARPGGPRRLRRGHRSDRPGARRARPARDRGGARGPARRLPAGADGQPGGPLDGPVPPARPAARRSLPARRTRCWPPRRSS